MPWGGGNSGTWGSSPWGDGGAGAPPALFPSAVIDEVIVLGTKLLRINFNVDMKIDSILTDPSNYSVTPVSTGNTVDVVEVLTPNGVSTNYVMLAITPFSVGSNYLADIVNVRTTRGNTVDLANSSSTFYGRQTKLDLVQSLQQKMYNRKPGAVMSSILIAIASEDDKIGGNEGNGSE